jgi:glycine cleavage system protein P-like pyridoxal-binding family
MDHQHVLALVEAVDGADLNAIGVFAFDAGFGDDVSHPQLRKTARNSGFA